MSITKSNAKKNEQLGIAYGTAVHHLRKKIMLALLIELGKNFCFQCGCEIESESDLSIEHKIPWLDSDNPSQLFWDLDNIAFSHLKCNVAASRPKARSHGKPRTYDKGCRCDSCRKAHADHLKKYR